MSVPPSHDVRSRNRTFAPLIRRGAVIFAAALTIVFATGSVSAEDDTAGRADWRDRQHLTGDWFGHRTRLEEAGFTVRSRLTQFLQGMPKGDGDKHFEYGGKLDFEVRTDLSKLGLWSGLSLTAKAEYNFGTTVNGRGGTLVTTNTALLFPGIDGSDAFDMSSFYFTQTFANSGALIFGKINMIDIAATKRFAGGAGIDSFWNITFAAPPSGFVPAYLFGALLSYKTRWATYGLWVYDPIDCVNRSCLEEPFSEGVTVHASVEIPVTIAGLAGHHGLAVRYSNREGANLNNAGQGRLLPFLVPSDDGLLLPDIDTREGALETLHERYYLAYTIDQYLYQSPSNPNEGVGVFGQFGISDGNPTRLYWAAHVGIGGTGLIPGRSEDTWGVGYYYYAWNDRLKDTVSQVATLRDEQGIEAFYNFQVAPWFTLGADLQIVEPGASESTAVFTGFRSVLEF